MKEEGAIPMSGRQKLSIPGDSHSHLTGRKQSSSPLPGRWESSFSWHSANPQRLRLLMQEKERSVFSTTPVTSLTLRKMRHLGPERPKASPMSQSWWQSQGFMEHDGGVGWERSVF